MEQIKNIYTKLSNGKIIDNDAAVIKSSDFNSIMADRFRAELKKLGINWDGSATSIAQLTGGVTTASVSTNAVTTSSQNNSLLPGENEIGIDIQHINEMPVCDDYWEDAFYQTNFSKEEIAYCVSRNEPLHSFAGVYAAKEALVKCSSANSWDNIVIAHNNNKPYYKNYLISISHSGDFAIAVAAKLAPTAGLVINETRPAPIAAVTKDTKTTKLALLAVFLCSLIIIYLALKETNII